MGDKMENIGDNPDDDLGFDMSILMGQQPSLFGAHGQDGSYDQNGSTGLQGQIFQDDTPIGVNDDNNDPKRRRIARVGISLFFFFFFFF